MEKSSEVFLSDAEKEMINGPLTKSAGLGDSRVPERFQGWYSHEELQELANEQHKKHRSKQNR